ncbi:MAG: leucine--tRNA ligase [Chitinophagia bacterium]|nr:leucine--tRNA ligase [Chitinophagia bacterium]
MDYQFADIERHWKQYWNNEQVYKVSNNTALPKYYVLDMFPYPSGAGLHVGHPLGYIASDIFARYKRLQGFNVLHPMGFDAFGLPAEQYALETGQHPSVTTEQNIARYRSQLDNIGFCFDWSREVRTSDPAYYKWTQWIFLQLFHSWYDRVAQRARPLADLLTIFRTEGNAAHPCPGNPSLTFTAAEWLAYEEAEQRDVLMNYRLAYQGYAQVWWCEALGTVLANDEVVNGVSERGGFPVERKNMRQWFLRITEFADRLLASLDALEWSEAMKEMQRNWIGKSVGAEVLFEVAPGSAAAGEGIKVFTTRPDTIFGVDFLVLAPEHPLVDRLTTPAEQPAVEAYLHYVKARSERERQAEVKTVTGCFTGAYALHPLTGRQVPIWIAEYVLAGYGTGAIMGVPSGDDRDHRFAQHFKIAITNIFGDAYTGEGAYSDKTGTLHNSDFVTGKTIPEAAAQVIDRLVALGKGARQENFRMRDAGFSRQRYWGEPFPIVYHNGIPYGVDELPEGVASLNELPVELPHIEQYKPGPEGEGPLANLANWVEIDAHSRRETNTMPGYAGSSWYFLRYMDPNNASEFASREATDYWQQVDLYVGGTEHAVGHLLYSRMWTKALYDLGFIGFDEPFRRLLNQGMIQGSSRMVYRVRGTRQFVSAGLKHQYETDEMHVDVNIVDGVELGMDAFRTWRPDLADATFLTEEGKYICGAETEKMSKSKYNVVNPDDIVAQYGADTFRMYEMFLGPVEISKPWDTKGIEGVHRFLKKFWRLFADEQNGWQVTDEEATPAELRILHKTIKKITDDIERFSFNTSVSQFMIAVNELTAAGCHKRAVLEPLVVLICPFAPHIAEELWHRLGNTTTVVAATWPACNEAWLVESTKVYPVAINGKPRVEMEFELEAPAAAIEAAVLGNETVQKWTEGKPVKKFIYVKGKMINVVV